MSSKLLIAYSTKGGASETYAKAIAETLKSDGIDVEIFDLKKDKPDISNFDTVVLGTGVRMYMVYRHWKKILKLRELHEKNLFMFLSSGMATEDPDKAVKKFLDPIVSKYGLKPDSLVSFPGIIPEKWAENEEQKNAVKPELAKKWAKDISSKIK
jgi:menaquinone-dependent protoporphyrinogen oxidase